MGGGADIKKMRMKSYFEMHPDSVTCICNGVEFPAFFDYSYQSNSKDAANVEQQKRSPHLTFYSDYATLLKRGEDIVVNGKSFKVYKVKSDLTDTTFQAEGWLI